MAIHRGASATSNGLRPGFGLQRGQRIRKRADFLRVQNSPARVPTKHLLLLVDVGSHEWTRLGVVASRKLGGAVVRNRVKRLVREAFRRHAGAFPPHVDVVVIARPGTHLLHLDDLAGELARAAPVVTRRALELKARAEARPDEPPRGRGRRA